MSVRGKWPAMPVVLVLALALLLVACDDGGGPSESTPTRTPSPEPTAGHPARIRPTDLIAPAETSFEVTFEWADPGLGHTGALVWRQGGGVRRWDKVWFESGRPAGGALSIQTGLSPGVRLPYEGMGCMWSRLPENTTPESADVSCGEGSPIPPFAPLFDLITDEFDAEELPDETIAGTLASCYALRNRMVSAAKFCLDSSRGIPLRVSMAYGRNPVPVMALRAVGVSMDEQDLGIPIELEEDAIYAPSFEGTVPISTLQLPDLSAFGE